VPVRHASEPPRTADLVVVGGGIVGAATAFFASRAGLRPVLVEKRPQLASFTTAAAAGGFRLQLDDPEDLALVRESVDLFLDFEERTGQRDHPAGVRRQGYLWVTTTEEGAERQRRLVAAQRSWGVDGIDVLTGDDARAAFGFLGPDVVQARFRQDDGLLDPRGVSFGLAAGSGAEVVTACEVTGFDTRAGRLAGVRTSRGTIGCGAAVVAAGPLSGRVAALAGVTLPLHALLRHRLVMPEVPEVPPEAPMTIDDDTAAHWRPAFRGAAVLFTDPAARPEEPADPVEPDPEFPFRVLDPASPAAVARVTPFWRSVWERGSDQWMLQAGQYTMTPDRRPLIGETEIPGLFVNTGYCGHGVMAGPGGSRHLAGILTGTGADAGDNPFRLDRGFDGRPRVDLL
jgi:sarcosine oxidase, subunit beta